MEPERRGRGHGLNRRGLRPGLAKLNQEGVVTGDRFPVALERPVQRIGPAVAEPEPAELAGEGLMSITVLSHEGLDVRQVLDGLRLRGLAGQGVLVPRLKAVLIAVKN